MSKILFLCLIIPLIFSDIYENIPQDTEDELDQKIGQMLLVGFRGLKVSENDQIARDIISGRIGGVILFDRDIELKSDTRNIKSPEQLKSLITNLQSFALVPLFISIDQEGGRVNRLKEKYGFPKTVSQQYLGKLNNSDSTKYYAEGMAITMKNAGINLNFAPVVDLNVNQESPAIGKLERSYSSRPDIVKINSEIFIAAHHRVNILTALKHFPGHGSATNDTHLGFTDVTSTWQSSELEPFRDLLKSGYDDLVMTAHIFNANLDPLNPATLSRNIIHGILREQLGYDGVIISDDMNMGAITNHYEFEEAIEKTINAGVDILLFGNNLVYDKKIAEKATVIIKKLIKEKKISKERIEESYRRIIKLKKRIFGDDIKEQNF